MNPDSITYLTGAGMVADLFAWFCVALCMVAIAFGLGMWLAQQRKRRVARAAVAMKNWEHVVGPPIHEELRSDNWQCVPLNVVTDESGTHYFTGAQQPTAPACGVAKSCNECSTCPDLEIKHGI